MVRRCQKQKDAEHGGEFGGRLLGLWEVAGFGLISWHDPACKAYWCEQLPDHSVGSGATHEPTYYAMLINLV